MEQRLITPLGMASRLGVSSEELRRMIKNQQIPCVELPCGQVRFSEQAVNEWIRRLASDGTSQRA